VKLEEAGLTWQAGAGCRDTVLRPGAVGHVLPGIGRSLVVMLLDREELTRFHACVEKTPLSPDATPALAQERTRLTAPLEQVRKRKWPSSWRWEVMTEMQVQGALGSTQIAGQGQMKDTRASGAHFFWPPGNARACRPA
jgi:hypothetical protein